MTIRAVAVVSGHVQGVVPAPVQGPAPSVRGVGGSGVLSGRVEVALEGADDDVRAAVAAPSGPGAPGTVTSVGRPRRAGTGEQRLHRGVTNATPPRYGRTAGFALTSGGRPVTL